MVGPWGLEPQTSTVSKKRCRQLSDIVYIGLHFKELENCSMYEGRIERQGVLIDHPRKRRTPIPNERLAALFFGSYIFDSLDSDLIRPWLNSKPCYKLPICSNAHIAINQFQIKQ